MSSNLTGQFIANTFQNLLQIDSTNTQNSTTILNGIGQVSTKVTIDSNSDGNGGLFIKDGQTAGRVMGIQYVNSSGGDAGLNFWTPGSINANLFLRRTGTAWIGYNDGGSVVIPNDISGEFNLYVKKGIQVGYVTPPYLSNGRINITGEDPLPPDYGLFIDNQHPFIIHRYQIIGNDRIFLLKLNGSNVDIDKWSAMVVGINITGSTDDKIEVFRAFCFKDSGFWKCRVDRNPGDILGAYVDILLIKKGMYIDTRGNGTDPISITGGGSNPDYIINS